MQGPEGVDFELGANVLDGGFQGRCDGPERSCAGDYSVDFDDVVFGFELSIPG